MATTRKKKTKGKLRTKITLDDTGEAPPRKRAEQRKARTKKTVAKKAAEERPLGEPWGVRVDPQLLARLRIACATRAAEGKTPCRMRDVAEELLTTWLAKVGH